MADNTNPYMASAMAGLYGPNPYSPIPQGQPFPYPPTYHGTPTDAMGNPIQSFTNWQNANPPGTTLNSTPAQTQPAQGGITWQGNKAYNASGQPASESEIMQNATQQVGFEPVYGSVGRMSGQIIGDVRVPQAAPQQAAPQQQQSSGAPNNWQAALDALSNPGKVTTPGAQSGTGSLGPSVLDNFLASTRGGQGAGNYSNQAFFDTLNRLKGNTSAIGQGLAQHVMPSVEPQQ